MNFPDALHIHKQTWTTKAYEKSEVKNLLYPKFPVTPISCENGRVLNEDLLWIVQCNAAEFSLFDRWIRNWQW